MNCIHGKHIRLRLVQLDDAAFILSLRLNDALNQYLSSVSADLDAQETWIIEYKIREKDKREFYFIIESAECEALGTVRLYDFREDSFCWGSWIIKPDAPIYAAVESMLCLYDYAFKFLNFKQSHFEVRKDNIKVNAFHRGYGAILIAEDSLNYYYHLSREKYEAMKIKYKKYIKDE